MIQIPFSEDEKLVLIRLLRTPDGQQALKILEDNTIGKPVIQMVYPDSGNTLMAAAQREGQNSVVRQLKRLLEQVKNRVKEAN